MENMVEPDRTIMIVSIIGLVILWGSFFYHKLVQGGGGGEEESREGGEDAATEDSLESEAVPADRSQLEQNEGKAAKGGKKKGKKRR